MRLALSLGEPYSEEGDRTVGLLQPRGTLSWGSAPNFKQNAVNFTSTLTASPGAIVGATVPSTLRLPLSEFAILKSAIFCTVPFSASIICVMPCTPHERPLSECECRSSYLHLCDGKEARYVLSGRPSVYTPIERTSLLNNAAALP